MDGISVLCVSNRPEFLQWLLWNYNKQTYRGNRELIIVGLNLPVPYREDIVYVNTSGNIPTKRNIALRAAHFNTATWFDDDDWQHPEKLQILKSNVKYNCMVGCSISFFVSANKVDIYSGKRLLFNSAGFYRSFKTPKFNEEMDKASDYSWLKKMPEDRVIVPEILFFWISHKRNISNPEKRLRGSSSLEELKNRIGSHWGDTDKWLQHLKKQEVFGKHNQENSGEKPERA